MFTKLGLLIQKKAAFFFFIGLGTLPLFITTALVFSHCKTTAHYKAVVSTVSKKAIKTFPARAKRRAFLKRHSGIEPSILTTALEEFSLLSRERQKLEAALCHPLLANNQELKARLQCLSRNHIEFSQVKQNKNSEVSESHEQLKNKVQIDEYDLCSLLKMVENAEKKQPQAIITHLNLKRRSIFDHEVFDVDFSLLVRSFNEA